jgi:hypothetical protein
MWVIGALNSVIDIYSFIYIDILYEACFDAD